MTGPSVTTVLVVDDDEDLRDLVAAVLEGEGFAIETASNGFEALVILERSMPGLILLDMKMPVMNGWEFAQRFLEQHDRKAPIVVMTAAADAERRAQEIAAAASLGKPFDIDRLVATVRRYARVHPESA